MALNFWFGFSLAFLYDLLTALTVTLTLTALPELLLTLVLPETLVTLDDCEFVCVVPPIDCVELPAVKVMAELLTKVLTRVWLMLVVPPPSVKLRLGRGRSFTGKLGRKWGVKS